MYMVDYPKKNLTAFTCLRNIVAVLLIFLSVLLLLPDRYFGSETTAPSLSLENRILRLHILAAGNDTASQEIKLHVRDAILAHLQTAIADVSTARDAEAVLSPLLPEIISVANRTLEEYGVSYSARAEITTEFFPIKQYGSLLLPPGEYRALRIVLGEGAGKNWWCMLYPSLCFTEGITATISEDEKDELQGFLTEEDFDLLFSQEEIKPKFSFRILELLEKLWKKIKSSPE